jgi:hypothetical protein
VTRRILPALLALVLSTVAAACGNEDAGSSYSSCIDLASLPEVTLPGPISFPEGVHPTEVVEEEGYITASAVADGDVDRVFAPMEKELLDAGYEIINRDYEGFEAELFFTKDDDVAGVVGMRLGPCPEQVTLSVLYDPLETKGGRAALDQARERAEQRSGSSGPPTE